MVESASFTTTETRPERACGATCMFSVYAERRWLRFSLDRPCVVARIALWLGAHDDETAALCLVLMLLALAWG